MPLVLSNGASTTLTSGLSAITPAPLTLSVVSSALFPALSGAEFCHVAVVLPSGGFELMKVTAKGAGTLSVATRSIDGTSPQTFAIGAKVELRLVKVGMAEFVQREGGTMTGPLELAAPFASNTEAVDKAYVDAKVPVGGSFLSVVGAVTSSHTELNKLDGFTGTTADLERTVVATEGTTANSKVWTADANGDTKHAGALGFALTVITPSATPVIDFKSTLMQTLNVGAAITGMTTSNRYAGAMTEVYVVADVADRAVIFNANWVFLEYEPPMIFAGRNGILSLRCYGTAETDVVALWVEETT